MRKRRVAKSSTADSSNPFSVAIWHVQVIEDRGRNKWLGKLRISEECGSVGVDHIDVEGEKLVTGPVINV